MLITNNVTLPNHARLCYKSAIESVTASSGTAEDATTWTTADRWQPVESPATLTATFAEQDIDYVAIGAHTLSICATLLVEAYTTEWVTLTNEVPTDNEAILVLQSLTASQVRVTMTFSGEPPTVGKFMTGKALTMPRPFYGGHSPLALSRKTTRRPAPNQGSGWLGARKIRQSLETSMSWEHVTASWYRQNFEPFAEHLTKYPFFVAWNARDFPDCQYAWATSPVEPQHSGGRDWVSVSLSVRGFRDPVPPVLSLLNDWGSVADSPTQIQDWGLVTATPDFSEDWGTL